MSRIVLTPFFIIKNVPPIFGRYIVDAGERLELSSSKVMHLYGYHLPATPCDMCGGPDGNRTRVQTIYLNKSFLRNRFTFELFSCKSNEVFFMLRAYGTINRLDDERFHQSIINFVRKIENRFAVSIFEPQILPRSRCIVLVSFCVLTDS